MTPKMGIHYLLPLLFLLPTYTLAKYTKDNCTLAKNIYANHNIEFQRCAIQYAEPVHFCEMCVQRYIETTDSWRQLVDAKWQNVSCMDEYVNRDRLNLLLAVHGKSHQLWEAAACESCFEHLSNGTLTANQTEATGAFYGKLHVLNDCIAANKANTSEVCANCRGEYGDLNDHYMAHVQRSIAETDGVCFDLRDAMNRTRRAWSDVYKCCRDRHESLWAFAACSAVVAVLPVLFYALAVLQRRRSERFDQPLLGNRVLEGDDEDEELVNEASAPATGAALADTPATVANDDDDVSLLNGFGPIRPSTSGGAAVDAAKKLIDLSNTIEPAESEDEDLISADGEKEDEIARWKNMAAAEARKE